MLNFGHILPWMSFDFLYENFWVVQAFQIPIVLFIIVLLTFAAGRINSAELTTTGQVFEHTQLKFIKWIGYSFVFNLFYLCVNLQANLKIFNLSKQVNSVLEISSDMLCTVSFVLSSFYWYFTNEIKRHVDEPAQVKLYKIIWRVLLFCYGAMTLLICMRNYEIIFTKNEVKPENFSLEFFFFSLVSYFATGYCLFESMAVAKKDSKGNNGRYYVFIGFTCWAILQIFRPLLRTLMHVDGDKVEFVGFALSSAIKLSILYGFFIYFISMVRDAIVLKTKRLQDNATNLEQVQEYIKEVSSATSLQAIHNLLARHLGPQGVFQSQFFRFSTVDYLRQKIVRVIGEPTLEIMELDSDCPEAQAINRGEVIAVQTVLNDLKAHHLFMPVINYERHKVQQDVSSEPVSNKIIGVLEIEYPNADFPNDTNGSSSMRNLLDIYVDNFAQKFDQLSQSDIHANILAKLEHCDNSSGDDQKKYLEILLFQVCQYTHVDGGAIRILSFSEPENNFPQKAIYLREDIQTEIWSFTGCDEQLIKACCSEGELKINNGPALSEAVVPIKYEGLVIGCLEIACLKSQFFNDQNIYVLNRMMKDVGRFYITKKFHNSVTTLTFDNADLFDMESIFQPAVHCIQQYFLCDHVSIWSQEYISEVPTCIRSVTGQRVMEGKQPDINDLSHGSLRKKVPPYQPIELDTDDVTSSNHTSWAFGKKYNMKTLIYVPLMIDAQQYGFINLYSKRKIDRLFAEDIQILKLIATKCVISLVVSEMVRSFSNVTQSLVNKKPEEVLNDITIIAGKILHSDPVVLFLLDDDGNVKYKKTIYSGFIANAGKLYEGRKSVFLQTTLNIGKDRFYTSENELPNNFSIKDSFWEREKIKSLAAIPLKHEDKFIGAMYFNYRRDHSFTNLVKKMINTFSALATSAIINAGHVDQVGKNYEKTLETLERMLPASNASALADIVRAVNHDIRHSLTGISQNLVDIKNNVLDKKITDQTRRDLMANIDIVKNNINNATELIMLFDPSSFSITYTDLYTIANDVTKIFTGGRQKTESGISVTLHKPKQSMESIRCVRAELSMIIFNLINNARNAIVEKWKKNGKRTQNPEGNIQVRVGYSEHDKSHILEVEDDGTGIDYSDRPHLFEPGFTTRKNGLGIGLFFVRETIVNSYQGDVEFHTVVGDGTTFKVKFKQHKN